MSRNAENANLISASIIIASAVVMHTTNGSGFAVSEIKRYRSYYVELMLSDDVAGR